MKVYLACFVACCVMLAIPPRASAETIPRAVIGSGGGKSVNVDYQLVHTAGQPVINIVSGADYIHEQGFWYLPWFFITDVDEEGQTPKAYCLDQNFPNPFNPTTTITFALVRPSHVLLRIYDVMGKLMMTAVDREMGAGEHTVQLRASNLASGVYFYRLAAGRFVKTRKMVVLR